MKKIELEGTMYELLINEKEGYDEELIKAKYTDYYKEYDYIVGDIAYGKIRLKGFYNSDNKKASSINNYKDLDKYITNQCAFGCKYFVLKKI